MRTAEWPHATWSDDKWETGHAAFKISLISSGFRFFVRQRAVLYKLIFNGLIHDLYDHISHTLIYSETMQKILKYASFTPQTSLSHRLYLHAATRGAQLQALGLLLRPQEEQRGRGRGQTQNRRAKSYRSGTKLTRYFVQKEWFTAFTR